MMSVLEQLVAMSNHLGDPAMDCAILGEGNTSARADASSFWVKSSGTELRTIDRRSFVRMSFESVLAMLARPALSDQQVKQGLDEAKLDPSSGSRPAPADGLSPSIETMLHAICLSLDGVNFVGHIHPTAVNALTCSLDFEAAVSGRLFPDEIIVLGLAPVVIPYTDPGLPLAKAVRSLIHEHVDRYREVPKVVLMQNHGLIALGTTPREVENITTMAVKWARILAGTYAFGGPHFLTPAHVDRIHTRPDEEVRRQRIGMRHDGGQDG